MYTDKYTMYMTYDTNTYLHMSTIEMIPVCTYINYMYIYTSIK